MITRTKISFLIDICLIFMVSSASDQECDKTKCQGPLSFYEDLRCKPIYENPGDCCPMKYDCSHLKDRSPKKCYINNNVYELNDKLREEDALPCDIGCFCGSGYDGNAQFICAIVDCFQRPPPPGCKRIHYVNQCCPSEPKCPGNEELATCVVNGKTYFDGDKFEVKGEPEKKCSCKSGYKGENVEPFCYVQKSSYCRVELHHSREIREKCAPVYYYQQSPQTDCSVSYRCQNKNDTVIRRNSEGTEKPAKDESATCTFGNIEMKIGDELNQATDYSSVCVKCKCEVPPTPTCQRLSDEECDITIHPNFDN